jgi:hypothetical protein
VTTTSLRSLDTVAPTISDVEASSAYSSAFIYWTTDEYATSEVEYGTTSSYGLSAADSGSSRTHMVSLWDLTDGTTYHYRVISKDASGNEAKSGDYVFATSKLPAVRYEVTGSATSVSLTYQNESGGTSQIDPADMPWTYSFTGHYGDFLYISAQNNGETGSVTVTIYDRPVLEPT